MAKPMPKSVDQHDREGRDLLAAARVGSVEALSALFEARQVDKTYVAIVDGLLPVDPLWQLIDLPVWADWEARPLRRVDPRGQPSQTRWRCVAHVDGPTPASRLELQPITGRSHQLRVQCAGRNLPIVGDLTYGDFPANKAFAKTTSHKRLFLHSYSTSFDYDWQGKKFQFTATAPLPAEFAQLL
jgi:23S rRNA-/tRNA-specific pseudouridylate synthase